MFSLSHHGEVVARLTWIAATPDEVKELLEACHNTHEELDGWKATYDPHGIDPLFDFEVDDRDVIYSEVCVDKRGRTKEQVWAADYPWIIQLTVEASTEGDLSSAPHLFPESSNKVLATRIEYEDVIDQRYLNIHEPTVRYYFPGAAPSKTFKDGLESDGELPEFASAEDVGGLEFIQNSPNPKDWVISRVLYLPLAAWVIYVEWEENPVAEPLKTYYLPDLRGYIQYAAPEPNALSVRFSELCPCSESRSASPASVVLEEDPQTETRMGVVFGASATEHTEEEQVILGLKMTALTDPDEIGKDKVSPDREGFFAYLVRRLSEGGLEEAQIEDVKTNLQTALGGASDDPFLVASGVWKTRSEDAAKGTVLSEIESSPTPHGAGMFKLKHFLDYVAFPRYSYPTAVGDDESARRHWAPVGHRLKGIRVLESKSEEIALSPAPSPIPESFWTSEMDFLLDEPEAGSLMPIGVFEAPPSPPPPPPPVPMESWATGLDFPTGEPQGGHLTRIDFLNETGPGISRPEAAPWDPSFAEPARAKLKATVDVDDVIYDGMCQAWVDIAESDDYKSLFIGQERHTSHGSINEFCAADTEKVSWTSNPAILLHDKMTWNNRQRRWKMHHVLDLLLRPPTRLSAGMFYHTPDEHQPAYLETDEGGHVVARAFLQHDMLHSPVGDDGRPLPAYMEPHSEREEYFHHGRPMAYSSLRKPAVAYSTPTESGEFYFNEEGQLHDPGLDCASKVYKYVLSDDGETKAKALDSLSLWHCANGEWKEMPPCAFSGCKFENFTSDDSRDAVVEFFSPVSELRQTSEDMPRNTPLRVTFNVAHRRIESVLWTTRPNEKKMNDPRINLSELIQLTNGLYLYRIWIYYEDNSVLVRWYQPLQSRFRKAPQQGAEATEKLLHGIDKIMRTESGFSLGDLESLEAFPPSASESLSHLWLKSHVRPDVLTGQEGSLPIIAEYKRSLPVTSEWIARTKQEPKFVGYLYRSSFKHFAVIREDVDALLEGRAR